MEALPQSLTKPQLHALSIDYDSLRRLESNAQSTCCRSRRGRRRRLTVLSVASVTIFAIFCVRWASFLANTSSTRVSAVPNTKVTTSSGSKAKFFIMDIPEITSDLLKDHKAHYFFSNRSLNEDRAEIWLHRGLSNMTTQEGQTHDVDEADVVFIPGYLNYHLWLRHVQSRINLSVDDIADFVARRIVNKTKPHILLMPTTNPKATRDGGLATLVKTLVKDGVNLYSVGVEINPSWQVVDVSRIIPVPYVVTVHEPLAVMTENVVARRRDNFVFYHGNPRKNAVEWAGCNRSMIVPLSNRTDMDVSLVDGHEIPQHVYNKRMQESDYCLVLCGDTPTSRSLVSSMVAGCLPIRVGSRLRGLCEPPCIPGWGWTVSNRTHIPYADQINWNEFPEVNEAQFILDPVATLMGLFGHTPKKRKDELRSVMKGMLSAWIYGWGNPVNSTEFGGVYGHFWLSVQNHLGI